MADLPLVSIIVPVYNVEKYLAKCLDSIINQSFTNTEIIVVNDGSIDNSLAIIYKYCNLDNRIVCINKKNGGLASARNLGVEKARGKYIWHIDSDDYVENCLEKMVECIINHNVDIIVSGYYCENNSYEIIGVKTSRYKGVVTGEKALELMLKGVIGGEVWSKLYKRELYLKYNIKQDEQYSEAEDVMINFKLMSVASSVYFADFISVHHIYRTGSYSDRSKTIQFREKHYLGISTLCHLNMDIKIKEALYEYIAYDFLSILKLNSKFLLKKLGLFSPICIYNHLSHIQHNNIEGLFKRLCVEICRIKFLSFILSHIIYFYFVIKKMDK